jgi:hypothetical protein
MKTIIICFSYPGWTFGLPFRVFFITHIQTHGRTPLDERSARHRDLYLHMTTQQTNIHALIRIRDPSNQAAADLRLRPRGHWDRLSFYYYLIFVPNILLSILLKLLNLSYSVWARDQVSHPYQTGKLILYKLVLIFIASDKRFSTDVIYRISKHF